MARASQGVGRIASCRDPPLVAPGAVADAPEQPARADAGRLAAGPRRYDGTITPDTLDTMWGTELTTTITGPGQAAVLVARDHCSAECPGIHAHARATPFQALEPILQGVRQHSGGFAQAIARTPAVPRDHGSPYRSRQVQEAIAFLGIASSPAFVRAPEGNGCAKRFIRTRKKNLPWLRAFETVEEPRQALLGFPQRYNTTWLIKSHGFLSPAEYHRRHLQPHAPQPRLQSLSQKPRAVHNIQ